MRIRIAPSTAISLVALFFALGGGGLAATGGNFLLGVKNLAANTTTLKATTAGYALVVQNTAGPPLALIGKANKPPLAINSAIMVKNLNADYLDGLDSTAFVRTTAPLPHLVTIPFSLLTGGVSPPIALPVGIPVTVIGAVTNTGTDSLGEVRLIDQGVYLDWVGLESPNPSGITTGFVTGTGVTHIVYIDGSHLVDLKSDGPSSIQVHNGTSSTQNGVVTLTY